MAFPTEQNRPCALLTGHDGFTGRYLVPELKAAGYDVVGLSRGYGAGLAAIDADLLDPAAVRDAVETTRPDIVIHLAAVSFVAHDDIDEMYRVNVVGTRNLLAALANVHAPRLVILASSANVYGNAEVEPITEDTAPAPTNDYAVSKLAMEYMARTWMDRLPIVITRPFNYTGVGQSSRFLIPKIVDHFRRKAGDIELGNTRVWRDFGDVRDVARAYLSIARAAPAGQTLNICSNTAHSLDEVIAMMTDLAGYRIKVKVNPAFVRANEVVRLVGSNARLKKETGAVGCTPLRTTLEWMYSAAD